MAGLIVAFVVAVVWSIAAIWIGPIVGLVDTPGANELKVHKRPTPLLGGVGVFGGIHIGLAVADEFDRALFAGTLIILVLGLADDRLDLPPKLRLAIEVMAAVVLVSTIDAGLDSVGGYIFGTVLVVVAINAVNLLDGLDGLVASVTIVAALGLAWAGSEGLGDSTLGLTLAAATLGFLVLNRPQARIFLGDNGAYLIGMTLAYGALTTTPSGVAPMLLVGAGALAVFAVDLAVTVLRRRSAGKPLFEGDRSHIYDQLRDREWSIISIDLAAASAQALLGAVLIGAALADVPLIGAITIGLVVFAGAIGSLWRLGFVRP